MDKPYREGTSLEEIIKDGWSRGFAIGQIVHEAKAMGYSITLPECRVKWQELDEAYSQSDAGTIA